MSVPPTVRAMLDQFECPAILLGRDYRVLAANRAYIEHYGGGIRVGMSRCFEVSHGYSSPCDENDESCPLRQCLRTESPSRALHIHHSPRGPEHVDVELRPLRDGNSEIAWFIELIRPVKMASTGAHSGALIGRSRTFRDVLALVQRAAQSRVPVLLLGESGTGKELTARAVHEASPRAGGPIVPIECSMLAESLFEAELFGHERGAFTGAHQARRGLVAAAHGGTLFLDEIGDVPLSLQVKLLRLIETGTYRRVGSVEPERSDFRLICATNRDLAQMVRDGTFRRDLYYRINTFPIRLPPLRERGDDIRIIAESFLAECAGDKTLSHDAISALKAHSWPGNVRELRNILERAVLLSDGPILKRHHVIIEPAEEAFKSLESESSAQFGPALEVAPRVKPLADVEADYLRWARSVFPGGRKDLARALGLSERTLYRKLTALASRADS